jgi:hypothetical protein
MGACQLKMVILVRLFLFVANGGIFKVTNSNWVTTSQKQSRRNEHV